MKKRVMQVVIFLCFIFPFVGLIYELAKNDTLAAAIAGVIVIVWIAVMAFALRPRGSKTKGTKA